MVSQPLFSIIIPTRQRHDTLKYAIQSVIQQSYTNFELIVMDNLSSPETYEVVASFSDERIKYYRSPERLSMADNWELGLSYATGEYVFILGDDDALMPDGIELGLNLINRFDLDIVSWFRYQYWWPSVIVPSQRNRLYFNFLQVAQIWDSREKLKQFYKSQCIFENLPMIYNSFVNRDLINKIKSVHGRYFMSHTPDIESGILNAYFSEKYLYSFRSLSLAGLSGHSTGTSQGYSSFSSQALNQFKNEYKQKNNISIEIHESLTPTNSNQEIYVADASLKIKDLYFSDNPDIQLDIKGLLNLIAVRINRDSSQYETTLEEIRNIAEKHQISISEINIPAKITHQQEAYQGPLYNTDGSWNTLAINCDQLGVSDVAHAAMVCQALLPDPKFLQVHAGNHVYSYNNTQKVEQARKTPTIIIDGVFFQMYKTGIARVWSSLLEEWKNNGFGRHIMILDRDGTAPKIPGLWYRTIPAYDYNNTDADSQMLQEVCDQEGADLFISTYYTTPISTQSVFMAYDMIPEILEANLDEPMWREKHRGIAHASAYISISQSTANDLVKYFPNINSEITVAHCGVSSSFYPAPTEEIIQFKTKYGINKPYFLLVGAGSDYKNAILFFQGFAQITSKTGFDVVCTGTGYLLGTEYRDLAAGSIVHSLYLSDEELRAAYSGATALVYPSKYEGFGMPVAEALACGCPVITCPNSSIPEVAGEAAIYIKDDDIDGMTDALCEVQKLKVRNTLIAKGLEQAKKFSWSNMANQVSSALINATLLRLNLRDINWIIFPDWSQPEEIIYPELASIIKALLSHPDRSQITLLVDNSNISNEDADLALSSVMMNLLMADGLEEFDENVSISLIGELSDIQWSALVQKIQGKISLQHENTSVMLKVKADKIPSYQL